jgi:hypothetical protein
MSQCLGYAAASSKAPLVPFTFERREPGPSDKRIEIQYCGVCHSDLNRARYLGRLALSMRAWSLDCRARRGGRWPGE